MDIKYIEGDVTCPISLGPNIIVQVVNDIGAYGAGVSGSIAKKWNTVELQYRQWSNGKISKPDFKLGEVLFVRCTEYIEVANMVAQRGIRNRDNPIPLSYKSLGECLEKVGDRARACGAYVHMPKIGCGLAGGEWAEVVQYVRGCLGGIHTYVYYQ